MYSQESKKNPHSVWYCSKTSIKLTLTHWNKALPVLSTQTNQSHDGAGIPTSSGKIDLQADHLITTCTIKILHTSNAGQIFLFFLITDAPYSNHLSKQA